MEIKLRLGGILFLFRSEKPRIIDAELRNFLTDSQEAPDLTVDLSWDWAHVRLPRTPMAGEDAILRYYVEADMRFCLVRGGPKGPVACTCYTPDFQKILCTFHDEPFLCPPMCLGSVLRFLPMREIFLHFQVLFFHASQISYRGRGILFTAPSKTGKTTQARLWQRYRDAEIICNDRTLLRRMGGTWRTFGYPLDGSEPVRSGQILDLAAIVALEQGPVNQVERLHPGKAASMLMRQIVLDSWSAESRTASMDLLLTLLEHIPVYLLTCTPDEGAVEALEAKLTEDKVIPHEQDF